MMLATGHPTVAGSRGSSERIAPGPAALLLFGLGSQIALAIPGLVGLFIDDRLLNGVSVWDKPLKFELALVVNYVTLLLLMRALVPSGHFRPRLRLAALIVTVTSTYEIAYITLQASRGLASHFNFSSPIASIAYSLMGLGATALVGGIFLFGLEFAAMTVPPGSQGLRLGAILGLCLGAVLTLATAAIMSSQTISVGHWVGGALSDAKGLPLVGWSTTGGDLRVPHFFATHTMQALPILGFAADGVAPRSAKIIVLAGAVVASLMVVATFVQAATGHPLFV